jgi:hypothetical protein
MASYEFAQWLLQLRAIIDAEHPAYPRDADRWRPYFKRRLSTATGNRGRHASSRPRQPRLTAGGLKHGR